MNRITRELPPRRAQMCNRRDVFWCCALVGLVVGCAGPGPSAEPLNRPSESLLEVVSVLRRHVPDDTYRYAPARDFTGRNVYRASLLRLENLERVHDETLRAGTWDEVVPFSKARALERLRAYDLAAAAYREAARYRGTLRQEALRSAAICDALAEAITLGRQESADDAMPGPIQRATALSAYDTRIALLDELQREAEGGHYAHVVREERERADMERAGFLVDLRRLVPDGDVKALAALQRNVLDHRESKLQNTHLLALGDLYGDLARDYVVAHPPESLTFDPALFEELVDAGARLYESVSNQDGAPEKLEAARKLEAFLAFTLKVDRDRFSP